MRDFMQRRVRPSAPCFAELDENTDDKDAPGIQLPRHLSRFRSSPSSSDQSLFLVEPINWRTTLHSEYRKPVCVHQIVTALFGSCTADVGHNRHGQNLIRSPFSASKVTKRCRLDHPRGARPPYPVNLDTCDRRPIGDAWGCLVPRPFLLYDLYDLYAYILLFTDICIQTYTKFRISNA